MRRFVFGLLFSALFFLASVSSVLALCWCTPGQDCHTNGPSCAEAVDYEGHQICCSEPNLYNSTFALASPICGSAEEKGLLGCERGTYPDGSVVIFCVGNEFRLGKTDPVFDNKDNVTVPVSGSFTYNGNTYNKEGEVYVCNSIASCCANTQIKSCEDIIDVPVTTSLPGVTSKTEQTKSAFCGTIGEDNSDKVAYVHNVLDEYSLTCVNPPKVSVLREACGTASDPDGGDPLAKGITQIDPLTNKESIDVRAFVGLNNVKLGGLGPDDAAKRSYGPDGLARVYPYSALTDRPVTPSPREAFRTFWRLTNFMGQLNAKAKYIQKYLKQDPPMLNSDIAYGVDSTNSEPTTPADAKALADYMNTIIAGVAGNANIKLLSPAFNLTSRFTPPLIKGMIAAGANFGALDGCAGNTYTVDGQGAYSWFKGFLSNSGISGCRGWVFTEFGDFDTFSTPIDNRQTLIERMKAEYNKTAADGSVLGVLYFNALGGNSTFTGHKLSSTEIETIISGSPSKAGVNSALPFQDGGAFPSAVKSYSPSSSWDLEIAFSPGDAGKVGAAVAKANSLGITPVVRVCVGNTCDFADPVKYIAFLKQVAASGRFYALAGPNEPETEQWVTDTGEPDDGIVAKYKTIRLSDLINKLPGCLKNFPVCDNAVDSYSNLDALTKSQYDALLPFNQDNQRGYLALNSVNPTDGKTYPKIITEGLSYVQGTKDALDDPSYGIIRNLSAAWINEKREGQNTKDTYIKPNQEKGNGGLYDAIANIAKKVWPLDLIKDDPQNDIQGCFTHDQGVTLQAPVTYPNDLINPSGLVYPAEPVARSADQFIRVPVKTEKIENSDKCPIRNSLGQIIGHDTLYRTVPDESVNVRDSSQGIRGTVGRSVAVLNNPKMTDISRLITEPVGGINYSLTRMLLPSFVEQEYHDTPMLAQTATYDSTVYTVDKYTSDTAKAGGSESTAGPIERKDGQAEIDLCVFRNFWLLPGGIQRGGEGSCLGPASFAAVEPEPKTETPTDIPQEINCNKSAGAGNPGNLLSSSAVANKSYPSGSSKQNLLDCYNDVVSRSNGAGYDPALTMAIWLEESAASLYTSYPGVADFGCINSARMNFSTQIGCWLGLKNSYANSDSFRECRGADNRLSVKEFLLIFEGGYTSCRAGNFMLNPQFPDRIKNYYSLVTGGKSLNFDQILP